MFQPLYLKQQTFAQTLSAPQYVTKNKTFTAQPDRKCLNQYCFLAVFNAVVGHRECY